jgi:hypothetical protein
MQFVRKAYVAVIAACVILAFTIGVLFALAGCTKAESTGFGSDLPSNVRVINDEFVIGEPGEGVQDFSFTNRSGKTISVVALKAPGDEMFTSVVKGGDFIWADGTHVLLYKKVEAGALYDIQIVYDDGSASVLHGVVLSSIGAADLRVDAASTLTYLDYTDTLGQKKSTLASEQANKRAEDEAVAQAAAAEEQRRAEEEAAAAEAAAAASSYYYVPPSSGGSGVAQSTDSCLDF